MGECSVWARPQCTRDCARDQVCPGAGIVFMLWTESWVQIPYPPLPAVWLSTSSFPAHLYPSHGTWGCSVERQTHQRRRKRPRRAGARGLECRPKWPEDVQCREGWEGREGIEWHEWGEKHADLHTWSAAPHTSREVGGDTKHWGSVWLCDIEQVLACPTSQDCYQAPGLWPPLASLSAR